MVYALLVLLNNEIKFLQIEIDILKHIKQFYEMKCESRSEFV